MRVKVATQCTQDNTPFGVKLKEEGERGTLVKCLHVTDKAFLFQKKVMLFVQ